jgi:hypothetical protein
MQEVSGRLGEQERGWEKNQQLRSLSCSRHYQQVCAAPRLPVLGIKGQTHPKKVKEPSISGFTHATRNCRSRLEGKVSIAARFRHAQTCQHGQYHGDSKPFLAHPGRVLDATRNYALDSSGVSDFNSSVYCPCELDLGLVVFFCM